jgi:hypothetical protein
VIGIQTKDSGAAGGAPTFSRTLSKTTLLQKIRNAIGKQDTSLNDASLIAQIEPQGKKKSPKKQPRRFIVKRSQERNASNANNAAASQVLSI